MVLSCVLVLVPVTVLFLAFVIKLSSNGKKNKSSKLPPGSRGWPLIGETFGFLKKRQVTTIGEFMEQRIASFGKIFMSNLLGKPVLISADAEMTRFVLNNDMRLFEPAWTSAFLEVMGKFSLSVLVGDAHKRMRAIIVDFLNHERLRTVFLQHAEQVASEIVKSWKEEEGSVFTFTGETIKFSFYIMVKEIFSMSHDDPNCKLFMSEYDTLIRGITAIPWNLPGTEYWKALKSRREILNIFDRIIKGRTEEKSDDSSTHKDDLLDWVMRNTDYSHEQICDMMLHTLFTGYETVATSICLAIYFLDGCPGALQQLREEHLEVAALKEAEGNRKLTLEDCKNMEFTKCVINESLRLGNILSFVPKKTTTEIKYGDYVIPQGGNVILHLAAAHLDPSNFENPTSFNPWRWMNSTSATKNSFFGFGKGPRMCPGAELARLEITVFFHHLLLKYKWELAEPDHPEHLPALHFHKGLPIKVKPLSSRLSMV